MKALNGVLFTTMICILGAVFLSSCGNDDPANGGTGVDGHNDDDDDHDDADGIPRFVDVNYIELAKISRISRFRSGIGHDYSDEFESCRSMKHYFVPFNEIDWSEVHIVSPVDGTVLQRDEGWAGTQIRIESKDHPDVLFILFHVDAVDLEVGDFVTAGEPLGTHIGSETWSDIAVGYDSPNGWKLLSYFDVMTDALIESYQGRGMASRDDAIISEEARDADPLECDGEDFLSEGVIENWFSLD